MTEDIIYRANLLQNLIKQVNHAIEIVKSSGIKISRYKPNLGDDTVFLHHDIQKEMDNAVLAILKRHKEQLQNEFEEL